MRPIDPLQPAHASAEVEEEDDEEPFVYPGASEASIHSETQSQEVPEVPAALPPPEPPAERDPALLEEIYSAAAAGDLHILQTLFQTAVSSGSGGTEAFALANDATTRTGLTPLHGAASRGHLDVVQWCELHFLSCDMNSWLIISLGKWSNVQVP